MVTSNWTWSSGSLIWIIIFIDALTIAMLPILCVRRPSSFPYLCWDIWTSLLQSFRSWLDATRFLFVLLSHSGFAILFAIKKSSIQCASPGEFYALSFLTQTNVVQIVVDQEAVCGLVILFVIITSWFIPALGVYGFGIYLTLMTTSFQTAAFYLCGLAYLIYWRSTVPPKSTCDVEKRSTVNHETPSTIQATYANGYTIWIRKLC